MDEVAVLGLLEVGSHYLHCPIEWGQPDGVLLEFVRTCAVDGPWIAGGAATALYYEKPNEGDIDIWFANEEQLKRYRVWLTVNGGNIAKSNKRNETWDRFGVKVQLVTGQFFPSLIAVMESFDFRLCKFGTDGKQITFESEAPNDIRRGELRLTLNQNQNLPFYTLARVHKYGLKGFLPGDPQGILLTLASAAYSELAARGETGGGS